MSREGGDIEREKPPYESSSSMKVLRAVGQRVAQHRGGYDIVLLCLLQRDGESTVSCAREKQRTMMQALRGGTSGTTARVTGRLMSCVTKGGLDPFYWTRNGSTVVTGV